MLDPIIELDNQLAVDTTIHLHGIEGTSAADGTAVTQAPIRRGERFTYDFVAPRPGVYRAWGFPAGRVRAHTLCGVVGSAAALEYNPAAMGLLTFALNVTLDGCIDHREGIADDELHDYFTELMGAAGAMLFGRTTYELMESHWPAVARDESAPRAHREWAIALEAKPKYVVSSTRIDFPWANTIRLEGDLLEAVGQLKRKTPDGVLVGSPMLGSALERAGLIDEYRIVVHPVLAGHGPTLFQGLERSRRLALVGSKTLRSGVVALHLRPTDG